jgi:hypothetical protein
MEEDLILHHKFENNLHLIKFSNLIFSILCLQLFAMIALSFSGIGLYIVILCTPMPLFRLRTLYVKIILMWVWPTTLIPFVFQKGCWKNTGKEW